MEEQTHKRPRRVMVSDGKLLIMTEVPFKDCDCNIVKENIFTAFSGKAFLMLTESIQERINECVATLQANVRKAKRVNSALVEWEGGSFSVASYDAMEEAMERLFQGKLPSRLGAIQAIKALKEVTFLSVEYRNMVQRQRDLKMTLPEFSDVKNYIFNVMCEVALMSQD